MEKFVINKTKTKFNFSLFAPNKEKIAVSSKVYSTKASCKKGLNNRQVIYQHVSEKTLAFLAFLLPFCIKKACFLHNVPLST